MDWDIDWEDIGEGFERRVAVPWDDDGALSAGEDETGPWVGVVVEVRRDGFTGLASLWGIEDDGYGQCGGYVDEMIGEVTEWAKDDWHDQAAERLEVLAS